jgi:DNA-binding transcriptional LysR family regulator
VFVISQQIAALEREAGTRLVERHGRGIRLARRRTLRLDDLAVRPLAGPGPSREVVAAVRRGDQAPATLAMLEEVGGAGRRLSGL